MNFNSIVRYSLLFAILCFFSFVYCSTGEMDRSLSGTWRAVLESPGGELPFKLEIVEKENGIIEVFAINGEERVPFFSAKHTGNTIKLEIEHYDSIIKGTIDATGKRIEGVWSKWSTRESRIKKLTPHDGIESNIDLRQRK